MKKKYYHYWTEKRPAISVPFSGIIISLLLLLFSKKIPSPKTGPGIYYMNNKIRFRYSVFSNWRLREPQPPIRLRIQQEFPSRHQELPGHRFFHQPIPLEPIHKHLHNVSYSMRIYHQQKFRLL